MKPVRLTLCLGAFVLACAFLGAAAAANTDFPAWGGAVIGAALGTFFGLAFGGGLDKHPQLAQTPSMSRALSSACSGLMYSSVPTT
jgi:hypothetical protein